MGQPLRLPYPSYVGLFCQDCLAELPRRKRKGMPRHYCDRCRHLRAKAAEPIWNREPDKHARAIIGGAPDLLDVLIVPDADVASEVARSASGHDPLTFCDPYSPEPPTHSTYLAPGSEGVGQDYWKSTRNGEEAHQRSLAANGVNYGSYLSHDAATVQRRGGA